MGRRPRPTRLWASSKGFAVRAINANSRCTRGLRCRGLYLCSGDNPCSAAASGNDARALAVIPNANSNEVWCATTGAGLLRATIDKDVGPIVSQLDSEQGLPSQNAFAVLPEADGAPVLIGTNRGVVRYGPGHTVPTLFATRIIGKRVHQPAELAAGLNLEYPQNSLLLD